MPILIKNHKLEQILKRLLFLVICALLIFNLFQPEVTQAVEPEIRAILFYSPTCSHCQIVINEVLPGLIEEYGDNLVIIGVDVSNEKGQAIYQSAIIRYNIPQERFGVPTLIVGETILVGSAEIPEQFPGLISAGLSTGGIDWPDIPGLEAILIEQGLIDPELNNSVDIETEISSPLDEQGSTDDITTTENTQPNQNEMNNIELESSSSEGDANSDNDAEKLLEINSGNNTIEIQDVTSNESSDLYSRMYLRFKQDAGGNTVAVIVLILMLAGVVSVGYAYVTNKSFRILQFPGWTIPILAAAGILIAGYLSYIELTRTEAVCGPVGDCNTVQESPYAYLFGIIPIGLLGALGYLTILIAWILQKIGPISIRSICSTAVWLMAWIGVLFSIYLTFLEPFVIGATCAWCVTSAVIMTLILLASTQTVLDTDATEFSELN